MNKTLKNIISYALMLGAAAFLLWFSLKNIEAPAGKSKLDFIIDTWNKANKGYILLSGAVAVLSHLIRAERWRLMLLPIGYPVRLVASFFSVMVGYFINLAVPRGGEISRCLNLFRLESVPVETSAGTVVAERLIDVMFLLTFIGVSFLIEYDKLMSLLKDFMAKRGTADAASGNFSPIMWILLAVILLLGAAVVFLSKTGRLNGIILKLLAIWANMKKGLFSVFTLERKGAFIFYSFLIWVLYFLMAWLVMLAFEETKILGIEAALTVFTLGSIAMAMPLPGGTGSYHVLVPAGLYVFYGLATDKALAFTIVFHAWQTLVIIVFGFITVIGSQLMKPRKYESGR